MKKADQWQHLKVSEQQHTIELKGLCQLICYIFNYTLSYKFVIESLKNCMNKYPAYLSPHHFFVYVGLCFLFL